MIRTGAPGEGAVEIGRKLVNEFNNVPQIRRRYREYRTKRVILEYYEAMAEAMKTGKPYQTILDPPPADLCVAHPPRSSYQSSK